MPDTLVEVLIPDFQGNEDALKMIVGARPHVLNHNLETVPRLYPSVRPEADYRGSLALLKLAKHYDPSVPTKSGLMLGLGEDKQEVIAVMHDLRQAGCDILTLGQYLQPSFKHYKIVRYVTPEEFA